MRPAELTTTCEECGQTADYCDSVPDPSKPGANSNECGYRHKPLCWCHAAERRRVNTSRIQDLIYCEKQGLCRVDRGRAAGDCICGECSRDYRHHPHDIDHPYLNVLCDGSVVKL